MRDFAVAAVRPSGGVVRLEHKQMESGAGLEVKRGESRSCRRNQLPVVGVVSLRNFAKRHRACKSQ